MHPASAQPYNTDIMGTAVRDRAIRLLGRNIQQSVVAEAVGVTPSYITQLLEEPGVAEEVARLKAAELENAVEQADTIDAIKKAALQQIRGKLIFAKSPLEAARVFQILDNAKKITDNPSNDNGANQVISITLPKSMRGVVQLQLSADNQVIDVNGRSMAPLPSKALPALARERKLLAAEVVSKLPTPATESATAAVDNAVANQKLASLPDITTMMDGVKLVL